MYAAVQKSIPFIPSTTFLASFWQYLRSLSIILILINRTFNLQEMKNCVTSPSSLKSILYFSFYGVRNLKAVDGFFMFFIHTIIWFVTFLSDGKKCNQKLFKQQKHIASWVVFDFLYMLEKKSLLKLLYFIFFRWNMLYLSRKQLIEISFWFWHRKNDTRIYRHTSSNLFHIKSSIIY